MKEFHRRDFANRTGLAQAWTVKSADRLFTYSCHPLSAVIGHPLGGFSACSRSLTTLIIVPATGMSILALSPNRVIRAVQMESLITSCAAKCSMGSQSCQWKGSMLLSVTIRCIQPNVCPAKASSSCLPLPSHLCQPSLYRMYPGSLGFRSAILIRLKLWTTDCAIQMETKKCKLQILILIGLSPRLLSFVFAHTTNKAEDRTRVTPFSI